jgi:glycosyltransferase involved in cell wall biosynthesis
MACGTPCVATDVGDSARIVGDTGWLVPPRNSLALADALAEAITALQDAPNWHQRMQCARQRIVQEFDIRRMVERYQQTWQVACRQ